MLRHTFIHLPGVGPHRERTLWQQGILDWDRFLEAAEDGLLRKGIYKSAVPLVRQSLDAVAAGDAGFFHGRLPSRETWRLYSGVRRPGIVPGHRDDRPVRRLRPGDADRRLGRRQAGPVHQAASTSTSSPPTSPSFRSWSPSTAASSTCRSCGHIFPEARLDQAHIDLRFVLRSLGYRGGLKAIETEPGAHP